MKEITETITINVPARELFDFTLNPENTPKWVGGVVYEEASEYPPQVGTIYRNKSDDGTWIELEVVALKVGSMFEMRKVGDNHRVRYTFRSVGDSQCELEYRVVVDGGEISQRFSRENIQSILGDLKGFVEGGL